jgi:glycogen debranching enzyme
MSPARTPDGRRAGALAPELTAAPAPPEHLQAPPIPAEARADLLVIKSGELFLSARPTGDIMRQGVSGEGLYTHDTRHLSELHIAFGDTEPVLLSHSVDSGFSAVVNATNPHFGDESGESVLQDTLNLRRKLLIADRLYCEVELRSYCPQTVRVPLVVSLGADFADVFEIRGVRKRLARGRRLAPSTEADSVCFGYQGQDGVLRETAVELDPRPASIELDDDSVRASWMFELAPGEYRCVLITVLATRDGEWPEARSFGRAARELEDEVQAWRARCTRVESDNHPFQNVIAASMRDLHALLMPLGEGLIAAAGIPWYVAAFGRDSLLTSYESLLLNPRLARETLTVLAALQARTDEAWRDAEPGKILHELRMGELARAGLVPHTPYYGTVDATPLFVMLAGAYFRWTADTQTLSDLKPAIDAALDWIDRHGDADGDGFVEYQRRSPAGLSNQGWKDSEDAVIGADGRPARGPIALVEVQGYVYLAKLRIADVYDALGEPDRASSLREQADSLRAAFNDSFWNAHEGTFALALDGNKRQVMSVTSNPGHCLYCGIVDADKAQALAERLMAPDMFSGWGVRTLSGESVAYNPMSYHNGSVWPHDNAIVAAGLKRYGFSDATLRIATALFDVATSARDFRLAELYCGFDRAPASTIVGYPVACMPQAWAAVVPFMLLQAMLGISANAPLSTLDVIQPSLPSWLGRAELHGLRVGQATVSLAFTQIDGITGFSLLEQSGDLTVTMAATAG